MLRKYKLFEEPHRDTNTSLIEQQVADLTSQVESLSQQVGALNDANEIRYLQHQYGYYLDKCLYDEVVDLFAEDCAVHFLNGVYRDKEGARCLMQGGVHESRKPVPGFPPALWEAGVYENTYVRENGI